VEGRGSSGDRSLAAAATAASLAATTTTTTAAAALGTSGANGNPGGGTGLGRHGDGAVVGDERRRGGSSCVLAGDGSGSALAGRQGERRRIGALEVDDAVLLAGRISSGLGGLPAGGGVNANRRLAGKVVRTPAGLADGGIVAADDDIRLKRGTSAELGIGTGAFKLIAAAGVGPGIRAV